MLLPGAVRALCTDTFNQSHHLSVVQASHMTSPVSSFVYSPTKHFTELASQLYCVLPEGPWASYFTSLCFIFLFCKMG